MGIFAADPLMNYSAIVMFFVFLFLFFILCIFIVSIFKKEKKYDQSFEPKVAVIIPAYNEEKSIGACIKSILDSEYDQKKIKIILVDDGSKDKTCEEARKAFKGVKIIKTKHVGKAAALNLAIRTANEEIIACVDADVCLSKRALKEMILPLQDKDVGATNAVVIAKKGKNIIRHFQYVEYYMNNLIRVAFSKTFNNSIWFFGAVACYKRSALKKIDYFKSTLTEDMYTCLELNTHGYKIITVNDARIYTDGCANILSLMLQRMRWYYGALQALIRNKRVLAKNFSVPVLFLYINQFWWTLFALISIPIFIYQIIYWLPETGKFFYLFRWFSVLGPFYVLYKIPAGWLSLTNAFGIFAGIITLFLSILGIIRHGGKMIFGAVIGLFFYFPYTILLNLFIIFSLFRYGFAKNKLFKD